MSESKPEKQGTTGQSSTNATITFKEKFLAIAKTCQFAWFIGNLATVLFAFLYFLSYRNRGNSWNSVYYKLIYINVIESFGIILYNTYDQARSSITLSKLLNDDNFQYFVIALNLLFILPTMTLSIFPFLLFSAFHTATYFKNSILPILPLTDAKKKPLGDKLAAFITKYHDLSLYQAANFEILTLIYIVLKALVWSRGYWLGLVIYTFFVKLRDEKNPVMRNVLKQWEVRVDGLLSHPSLPVQVKEFWLKLKNGIKKYGSNSTITGVKKEE